MHSLRRTITCIGLTAVSSVALAGTNRQIITSIARALDNAMAQAEFTAAVASQGGELSRLTTDQFGELIKSEHVKWGRIVKVAGIKNE